MPLAKLDNLKVESIHLVDTPANDEEFIQVKGEMMQDEERMIALDMIDKGVETIAALGEDAAAMPELQKIRSILEDLKILLGAEGFEDSVATQEVDVAEAAIEESIEAIEVGAGEVEQSASSGGIEKFQGKILKETLRSLASVLKSLNLDAIIKEAKQSQIAEPVHFESEQSDSEGAAWAVSIIQEGVSANRFLHKRENLKQLARLCEGKPIYANHIPDGKQHELPERRIQEIVGYLEDCKVEYHPAPARVTGVARLVESEAGKELKNILRSAFKNGKKDLIGLSIEATGKKSMGTHEGRTVQIVENYRDVFSVDVVNAPSAGGSFDSMLRESISGKEAAEMKKIDDMTEEELRKIRPDLFKSHDERVAENKNKKDAAPSPSKDDRIKEAISPAMRKLYQRSVDQTVDATKLPDVAKDRLRESLRGMEDCDIEIAEQRISEEVKYFGEMHDAFKREDSVNDSSIVESIKGASEQVIEDLRDFFSPRPKKMHSFKKMYGAMTGDYKVRGRYDRNMETRMHEAQRIIASQNAELLRADPSTKLVREDHVTEITRATWSDMYADIIHQSVIKWMTEPTIKKWTDEVDLVVHRKVPLDDFEDNSALVMGGFTTLPTVAESAAYGALAGGGLDATKYEAAKRGGTTFVTREMIKGDQVGAIQDIPKMMAVAAAYTLYNFVWQTLIRANPSLTYDAFDLFDAANHANEPAAPAALTAAGLLAAINRMAVQSLPGASSTYAMSMVPKILWAGPASRELVFELIHSAQKVNATEDSTLPNFFNQYGIDQSVILDFIPLTGANSTDWGIIADPAFHPTVELGFIDGQEDPEVIVQDNAQTGEVFTNDRWTWKIRHEYGGSVLRHEPFDANLVP